MNNNNKTETAYAISPITKDELKVAMLQWAKEEGWNYTTTDVDTYFSLKASNIFALKVNNQFIGCVIVTVYHFDEKNFNLGSVGLYLVRKDFRGNILNDLHETPGSILWQQVNQLLQRCTISCLNSVSLPKLLNYYERKGFAKSNHTNLHLCSASFFSHPKLQDENNFNGLIYFNSSNEEITSYENKLFANTAGRKEFLNRWLARPDAIIAAYKDQDIEGYGVLTACGENEGKQILRLSPAYANSIDVASKIIFSLLYKAVKNNATQIELYVPNINGPILEILQSYGFTGLEKDACPLMKTNGNLDTNILMRTIALTPLEFPHESLLAALR